MKALAPLLAALWLAAPASGVVIPDTEGVQEAQLYADPNGFVRAHLAFVKGRELWTDQLTVDWSPTPKAQLPDADARIAGVRPGAVLVESRTGRWLRLYVQSSPRWRTIRIADAPKRGLLGPAGLTLNRAGRPTVAYSTRDSDDQTSLWLVQVRQNRTLARTRVTRNGFPISVVPPASQPVLMPNGTLRVVQTFSQRGANAIFWRREGSRWWGRVLHASVLGVAPFPIFASSPVGEEVYLAWTVAYAAQRELHLVFTSRTTRSRSVVVHRNAIAAALLFGPNGPEVAANENVAGLTAGLVFWPNIVTGILPNPPLEVDGRILGYARDSDGGVQLLLAREGRVEWFLEPGVPTTRIVLDGPLSGRIQGASPDGVVRVYRERAGVPREVVGDATIDATGRFVATDAAPAPGSHYRFVYQRDELSFPYAYLAREPVR